MATTSAVSRRLASPARDVDPPRLQKHHGVGGGLALRLAADSRPQGTADTARCLENSPPSDAAELEILTPVTPAQIKEQAREQQRAVKRVNSTVIPAAHSPAVVRRPLQRPLHAVHQASMAIEKPLRSQRTISLEAWMRSFLKAFHTFRFYFHPAGVPQAEHELADSMRRVAQLGATVLQFFSNDVTHVIVPNAACPQPVSPTAASKRRRLGMPDDPAEVPDPVLKQAQQWSMKIWTLTKLLNKVLRLLQPRDDEEETQLVHAIEGDRRGRGSTLHLLDTADENGEVSALYAHGATTTSAYKSDWFANAWNDQDQSWRLPAVAIARLIRRRHLRQAAERMPHLGTVEQLSRAIDKATPRPTNLVLPRNTPTPARTQREPRVYWKAMRGYYIIVVDALGKHRPAIIQDWGPESLEWPRLYLPLTAAAMQFANPEIAQAFQDAVNSGRCPFQRPQRRSKRKRSESTETAGQSTPKADRLGKENMPLKRDIAVAVSPTAQRNKAIIGVDDIAIASGLRESTATTASNVLPANSRSLAITGSVMSRVLSRPTTRDLELLERRTHGLSKLINGRPAPIQPVHETAEMSGLGVERADNAKHIEVSSVPQRPGYCENCKIRFDDVDLHAQTARHRRLAAEENRWAGVDDLLKQLQRPVKRADEEVY